MPTTVQGPPNGIPDNSVGIINPLLEQPGFSRDKGPTFLIYTDDVYLNNGSENPRSGCAFIFKLSPTNGNGHYFFRLENERPTAEQPESVKFIDTKGVLV
ncbi:hypothetical protein ASPWEDRAFT_167984 [Aspergillus wentii DTO 134E9]|uniref:Uncharacterized protein n=1 Tax=Aspergillus wentii DTO 134E9 TaxID=1073089 RepID=A0A1L9RSW9_ASPWE|nr:uncharacterized protein ASPWEDRAFT_167984 [Aspergillus wentii DTO 134E9]KAI9933712.1 hypothetical protein MW887_004783 [Aspergillus wentii]OJJ38051.1 hypothetical protein ASPWEDRAFT_167984 [Aspergillus wentii DTO 134E9]